jgi:Uma2 family endonuclease
MQILSTYRFSVEDYHRLVDAGILGEDDRVELLDGDLVVMAPISGPHRGVVDWLAMFHTDARRGRYNVGVQNPVLLNDRSEPQPDVALYRPALRNTHPEPEDIFLLVEVAASSLAYDLGTKLEAYARAGIHETWVIDVVGTELHVHRDPDQLNRRYRDVQTLRPGAVARVAAFPDVCVPVAGLFGAVR